MTFKEFDQLLVKHTRARIAMSQYKSVEYANSSDRLANFKRLGCELGLRPEAVLMVYMRKHIDSVHNYVARGCNDDGAESIVGRIYDIQNYCDLLIGLIEEGKGEHANSKTS